MGLTVPAQYRLFTLTLSSLNLHLSLHPPPVVNYHRNSQLVVGKVDLKFAGVVAGPAKTDRHPV